MGALSTASPPDALKARSHIRCETTAAVEADLANPGTVEDTDLRERYATEARRMQTSHDPEDPV